MRRKMSFDIKNLPNSLKNELKVDDKFTFDFICELIDKAFHDGLSLGAASSYDSVLHSAVLDYLDDSN
jgi:hypothetical protein